MKLKLKPFMEFKMVRLKLLVIIIFSIVFINSSLGQIKKTDNGCEVDFSIFENYETMAFANWDGNPSLEFPMVQFSVLDSVEGYIAIIGILIIIWYIKKRDGGCFAFYALVLLIMIALIGFVITLVNINAIKQTSQEFSLGYASFTNLDKVNAEFLPWKSPNKAELGKMYGAVLALTASNRNARSFLEIDSEIKKYLKKAILNSSERRAISAFYIGKANKCDDLLQAREYIRYSIRFCNELLSENNLCLANFKIAIESLKSNAVLDDMVIKSINCRNVLPDRLLVNMKAINTLNYVKKNLSDNDKTRELPVLISCLEAELKDGERLGIELPYIKCKLSSLLDLHGFSLFLSNKNNEALKQLGKSDKLWMPIQSRDELKAKIFAAIGGDLIQNGEWEHGLKYFRDALAVNQDSIIPIEDLFLALIIIGKTMIETQSYDRARELFSEASELGVNDGLAKKCAESIERGKSDWFTHNLKFLVLLKYAAIYPDSRLGFDTDRPDVKVEITRNESKFILGDAVMDNFFPVFCRGYTLMLSANDSWRISFVDIDFSNNDLIDNIEFYGIPLSGVYFSSKKRVTCRIKIIPFISDSEQYYKFPEEENDILTNPGRSIENLIIAKNAYSQMEINLIYRRVISQALAMTINIAMELFDVPYSEILNIIIENSIINPIFDIP